MSVNMVAAYAQYLSIFLLEPAVELPEGGGLGGSTRGEIEHVEGQNYILFTFELAQGQVTLAHRSQFKIGGYIANFSRHIPAFNA